MSKKKIKLSFELPFRKNATPEWFFRNMPYVLEKYVIEHNEKSPAFVISSRSNFKPGKFVKIFFNLELVSLNFNKYDWAISWLYEDRVKNEKYFRLPSYTFNGAGEDLLMPDTLSVEDIIKRKNKFCAFVYYNGNPKERKQFFKMLSKYKKIDSPGRVFKNMPAIGNYAGPGKSRFSKEKYVEKVNFLSPYKFTIAFENNSTIGYTDEKIYHPMKVNSIPIYWGNPLIRRDFNINSFIHPYAKGLKFKNNKQMFEYMIERIIQLDKNVDLYADFIKRPWYPNNKLTKYTNPAIILRKFEKIFEAV